MTTEIPRQQLRKAFLQTLTKLAESDPRIIFIVGDVGFSFIEEFKAKFPNQYLNPGVLEQSMMGIAAGLARAGWKPYVYTMMNFVLLRPLEQVRNDICYGNANVKLFGVKGSEAYKFLGYSHNMEPGEDEAILKTLKNMNWYKLPTEAEVAEKIEEEYHREGPAYFQL